MAGKLMSTNDIHGVKPLSPQQILRERLIEEWLGATSESEKLRFKVTCLKEHEGRRRAILKPLSETVFVHHSDPAIAKKKLARLGYPKLAAEVDRRPKGHKTRAGNFGEILAFEFLRQLRGYEIPVYRLRYNTNDESSPKGDDVLAFEFADRSSGKKDSVIVAEAKVRADFQSAVVDEASESLRKGFRPRPKSFPFVIEILYREGRDEEAERLLDLSRKFGKRSLMRRSCLFLVTGNEPRNPFGSLVGKAIPPALEAVHLTLPEMSSFIGELFEAEVDIDAF